MPEVYSSVIISENHDVRVAMKMWFNAHSLPVLAAFSNVNDAAIYPFGLQPDLIVFEIPVPLNDVYADCCSLLRKYPKTCLVGLCGEEKNKSVARQLARGGARGCFYRMKTNQDTLYTIRKMIKKEGGVCPLSWMNFASL